MNTSRLQSGNLGRWFEELCRIRHRKLRYVIVSTGTRIATGKLPRKGGVYAFWWTGPLEILRNQANRSIVLPGPNKRPVALEFDDEWLGLSTELPVPLYIGKTAGSIAKRIGQHIRLSEARLLPLGLSEQKQKRPTTSCQLRAGVEHIFPYERDTRALILDNVGLSYVVLDGDEHAAHRFYLEDLAIGMMHPPFNVDIER
jgi:hypothetical protein